MSEGLQHIAGVSHSTTKLLRPTVNGGDSNAPTLVSTPIRYGRCGRLSHFADECTDCEVTCFNYIEKGHINTNYLHPRKEKASGSLNT